MVYRQGKKTEREGVLCHLEWWRDDLVEMWPWSHKPDDKGCPLFLPMFICQADPCEAALSIVIAVERPSLSEDGGLKGVRRYMAADRTRWSCTSGWTEFMEYGVVVDKKEWRSYAGAARRSRGIHGP